MTGARGYSSAQAAKNAAALAGHTKFVVIRNGRRSEWGWISPVSAYMDRAARAFAAGITVTELVQ